MTSYLKLTTLLVLIFLSCFSQEKFTIKDLQGEWIAYKRTTLKGEDGRELTLSGEPYEADMYLKFGKRKVTVIQVQKEYLLNFKLEGDKLSFGNRNYTIVKLSKSELVIKENTFLGFIVYLKRKND